MKLPKFVLLIFFLCTGCREEIAQHVHEREIGRVMTSLHAAGIAAERSKQPDGRWIVTVQPKYVTRALELLESHRLIKTRNEPVEENTLFMSEKEQSFRFERTLSKSIEETLYALEGVFDAKVHLTIPSSDTMLGPKRENRTQGSGSVLIIASADLLVTPEEIGHLVAGASGVPADAITVLIKGGDSLPHEKPRPPSAEPAQVPIVVIAGILLIGASIVVFRAKQILSRRALPGSVI